MPAIAHQNKILGNTSGGGSTILVTTSESSLYGQTVSLTDGTTTMNGTFSNAGECEFTGVMMVGTLTASSGGASTSIQVPYFGVYSMTLSFFSATITVTFGGGTCTCVGNGESYTASSSPYTFTVHGAATYTITNTIDGVSKTDTVTITTDGQSESVTISFGTINVTYDNDFRGTSITCTQGGTTITKTAPSAGNTMSFYPPTTGTWVISGTVGGQSYSTSATITTLSTPESAILQTLVQITATIYSATEDTVTFTDDAGVSHTEVFASGQSSKSITFKILPTGSSITFTSSVAKDPDNLSNDYTKTVSLTSSTTEVYVMPDNALYWWGYKSADCLSMDNTWTWEGITTITAPTYTTHYVDCTSSASTASGVYKTTQVSTSQTCKCIAEGVTGSGNYGSFANTNGKNMSNTDVVVVVDTTSLKTYSLTPTVASYLMYASPIGRGSHLYALWTE